MTDRLQKIIAARGICSRRRAEELIAAGKVTCNGQVAQLGDSADPEQDRILVEGRALPSQERKVYILLNKPRGYVTTLKDEKGRKNAAQLVSDCGLRVYPVGRLDMDSEGLLLFTNDGDFAHALMHPSHEVDKTYRVTVTDYSPQALAALEEPMTLDGYALRKPQVRLIRTLERGRALLEITIHEGRNRQVRRMCAAVGMGVTRLVRIREGSLMLGDLPQGKWRYLTQQEVDALR